MLFIALALIGFSVTVNAQSVFLDTNVVQKNELRITQEITKIVKNTIYMFLENVPNEMLSNYGIKNMPQLLNSQLGRPIPVYMLDNQNLKFSGFWRLPILSDDEFIAFATVKLTDSGQCEVVDFGAAPLAKVINDYKHKDLIIGILKVYEQNTDYLYIQKENKDIFLKMSDLKGKEYSLSDINNIIPTVQIKETK